ncbi:adenylate cyclase [Pelomyxa schiedti]|nr:adenylate cyclase [Pelomyxa schiedti]
MAVCLSVFLILPLRNLARDMRNLSKLRFKPLGRTAGFFTELRSMLRDYMAMKQGIHAFSRYVSASVVRQLLEGDNKMSSLYLERHTVTIVFMDVVGFTSLCEKLAPSTLVTLLSVFMQRMCQVLISEGATVDKFIGDCIMSFWNHPHACEDHTFKAINAVLRCYKELDELNKENVAKGLPELQFRAGINTGAVLVGNFGSPDRFDYTVLGDTVNVAARLEQLNKEFGTKLLISESAYKCVVGRFSIHSKGDIAIRGREAKAHTGKSERQDRRLHHQRASHQGVSQSRDRGRRIDPLHAQNDPVEVRDLGGGQHVPGLAPPVQGPGHAEEREADEVHEGGKGQGQAAGAAAHGQQDREAREFAEALLRQEEQGGPRAGGKEGQGGGEVGGAGGQHEVEEDQGREAGEEREAEVAHARRGQGQVRSHGYHEECAGSPRGEHVAGEIGPEDY